MEENIYTKLSTDLPDEAFKKIPKEETDYGFDIITHNYQYVINRLNEIVGMGNWRMEEDKTDVEKTTNGLFQVSKKIIIEIGKWRMVGNENVFEIQTKVWNYGSGESRILGDAHKAALSNGIKKAAAMLGIGKKTYELSVDQDLVELVKVGNKVPESSVDKLEMYTDKIKKAKDLKSLEAVKKIITNDTQLKQDVRIQLQKIYHLKLKTYETKETNEKEHTNGEQDSE